MKTTPQPRVAAGTAHVAARVLTAARLNNLPALEWELAQASMPAVDGPTACEHRELLAAAAALSLRSVAGIRRREKHAAESLEISLRLLGHLARST